MTSDLEVHEDIDSGYKSLYASQKLKPAVILSAFSGKELLSKPTRYTVQVDESQHVKLNPEYLRYINHSCDPNVFFDTTNMALTTLKTIKPGEELTFFYPSTEWKMNEPFECSCKSPQCLKYIRGAAFLSYDNLIDYRLTEYIIKKYSQLEAVQMERFA